MGRWANNPVKLKKINIIETDPDCFININTSKSPSQPIKTLLSIDIPACDILRRNYWPVINKIYMDK